MTNSKSAAELTLEDVVAHSVWRYKDESTLLPDEDESWLEPVDPDTVYPAYNHFFVTLVTLADGSTETVLVGNTEPLDPQLNEQVQFFVFFRAAGQLRWRPSQDTAGALAKFLGRQPQHVFPFRFNIRRYLVGDPDALARSVWAGATSSEA